MESLITHALFLIESAPDIRPPWYSIPVSTHLVKRVLLTGGSLRSLSDLISGGLDVPDRRGGNFEHSNRFPSLLALFSSFPIPILTLIYDGDANNPAFRL